MTATSPQEAMAIAISRRLQDGWLGIVGAASAVPIAGVLLAKRLHAPRLRWICSGTGFVSPTPSRLYPSSTQFEYGEGAEAVLPYHEIAALFDRGFDFGFFGGLEIDRHGNANTTVTRSGRPGPGPAGLPAGMARTANVILYSGHHTPRALVEGVRHRTGAGGPNVRAMVTPLAVFAMTDDGFQVESVFDDEVDVAAATGFAVDVSEALPFIPRDEEVAELRAIDSDGVLRASG